MNSDWILAPNIHTHPAIYELENLAIERDGRLQRALREVADWSGKNLVDIGCGTGFWLPRYADAHDVVGIEPDPALLSIAQQRVHPHSVLAGSAEHLPLSDDAADIVHARFAYFFGAGAEAGLQEVRRVLAPGGVFVAIDNSWRSGDFADLLRDSHGGNAVFDPAVTDAWWRDQGAERIEVGSGWAAETAQQLEAILRIEFPADTVDRYLARKQQATLSYAVALYVVRG